MELVERTLALLSTMTEEELRTLKAKINELLEEKSREKLYKLKKGDKVKVMQNGKVKWTGVVEKTMIKNVVVTRDGTGMRYRVPASMLMRN